MNGAIPVARGCGTRKKGGIYLEVGLSPFGMPLEHFLIDPPWPVLGEGFPNQGVNMVEREGVWHVLDRVGASYYPNVADFVEEARRFGVSRRAQRTLKFGKLTKDSRIILAHPRAYIANWQEFNKALEPFLCIRALLPDGCPKHIKAEHLRDNTMCAGLWWEDIDPKLGTVEPADAIKGSRLVRRVMPSFSYEAHRRPEEITPEYQLGAFLSLPLTRIVVVEGGREGFENLEKVRASGCGLPVESVKE